MKRIASVRDSTTLFCLRTFKAIMYNNVRSEISSKQTLRKLWVYFCFNQYINLVYFFIFNYHILCIISFC